MQRATIGLMLLIAFTGCSRPTPPASPALTEEDVVEALQRQVAEQEVASAQAVANYVSKITTQFDDLDSPVDELLRQLPGVVQVEVLVKSEKPTHRIIHLRDWHFVPKELFAVGENEKNGRVLSDGEIDGLYQKFLLEVELVQLEQTALLRCLIKHHGLKRVFAEGFSPKELNAYRERIAALKAMEEKQIPRVRQQLDEVRSLKDDGMDEKIRVIESQLQKMLSEHRVRMLEMGAAGRLLISGELGDVLPLEDGDTFDAANPVSQNGLKFDPEKIKARHDAQVKAASNEGPVGFVILGGSHDLSESVRRMGGCEYLRVTTKGFSTFSPPP